MNYNIMFQNVLLCTKYSLGIYDHIELQIVNIMHLYIVAQVFQISSIWHYYFLLHSFPMSKFKIRIRSKSCTVRNVLKKQDFHKYFISIHFYEKKHSFYNSGTICGGFITLYPPDQK